MVKYINTILENKYLLSLTVIIISLPILFLPLFSDITIFVMMGDVILNGGTIYYDFIDLKPPFFYMIFALQNFLIGNSEIQTRISSLILIYIFSFFLYKTTYKLTLSKKISAVNILLFNVWYVSLGQNLSITPEIYYLIPFSAIIYLLIINLENSKFRGIYSFVSGVLFCLIFAMKYTLGIVGIAILLYVWLVAKRNKNFKLFFNYSIFFIIGFIITLPFVFILFFDAKVLKYYILNLEYIKYYSQFPEYTSMFFWESSREFFFKSISKLSILYNILFIIPAIYLIKYKSFINFKNINNLKFYSEKPIVIFAYTLYFLLIITLVIERKISDFHFARLILPIFLILPISLLILKETLIEKYKNKLSLITISIIFVFVLLSPFPRYIKQVVIDYGYFFDKNVYYYFYQQPKKVPDFTLLDYHKIVDFVFNKIKVVNIEKNKTQKSYNLPKSNGTPYNIIVSGIGVNNINYLINQKDETIKLSKFAQSCFYISEQEIKEYVELFRKELQTADILIINDNDASWIINFHDKTTYQVINEKYKDEMTKFEKIKKIGSYYIYIKKK